MLILPSSFWQYYSKLNRPIKSITLKSNHFYQLTPNYHPQRSCEVYVFIGVCLSTGGEGVRGGPGPGGFGIQACTQADPPGETATAADGMHPTGMHSCFTLTDT